MQYFATGTGVQLQGQVIWCDLNTSRSTTKALYCHFTQLQRHESLSQLHA